jgi:hypothetical protein
MRSVRTVESYARLDHISYNILGKNRKQNQYKIEQIKTDEVR